MNPKPEESARNLSSTLHDLTGGAFKAQADLSQALVDALSSIEGMPKQAIETIHKFHDAGIKLRGTQEKMFDAYFDVLKKFDPTAALFSMVGGAAAKPIALVGEIAQKAVRAQVDLIQAFGKAVGGLTRKKPADK